MKNFNITVLLKSNFYIKPLLVKGSFIIKTSLLKNKILNMTFLEWKHKDLKPQKNKINLIHNLTCHEDINAYASPNHKFEIINQT